MAIRKQSSMGMRPIGIAIVMQGEDGSLLLVGSKDVRSGQIDANVDYGIDHFLLHGAPKQNFHFEAECDSMFIHCRTQPTAPAIEGPRGIYLPDMSFRVLPDNETKS